MLLLLLFLRRPLLLSSQILDIIMLVTYDKLLYVSPSYALLKSALVAAYRWRHQEIWLHVDQDNHAAIRLYNNLGYKVVSTDREWRIPFKARFLMSKSLPTRVASAPPSTESTGASPEAVATVASSLATSSPTEATDIDASSVYVWTKNVSAVTEPE